jgi:hypothetical protein
LKKLKLHNNVTTIPIIQYFKYFETGDLRYLLFLEKHEINNLPEIEITEEFNEAFIKLFDSINNIDIQEQNLQFDMLKSTILKTAKCNYHFKRYFDYLINNYEKLYFNGEEINLIEKYELLKSKYQGDELKKIRANYLYGITKEKERDYDFYKTLIILESDHSIKLDEYTDSYHKLYTAMQMVEDKNKKLKDAQRNNEKTR